MLIRNFVLIVLTFMVTPAAALSQRELQEAGFHFEPGAALPVETRLRDTHERSTTLGLALDRKPALLVFTDYRCQSLCGVILDQLAETLPRMTLKLRDDYNVIVVPLDATQTATDAAAFRDRHTRGSSLHDQGLFFVNDAPALLALRASVGLVAPYDADHQQFAHPAGLVLVDGEGKAQRVLSPFALDPLDLKLALTEGGAAPSLAAHALLLCYGWNPVAGLYTLRIERVLMGAAAVTILLIGLTLAVFFYRERRLVRDT